LTHHSLIQKKTTLSFTGTCECGKWSRLVLGRDMFTQAELQTEYHLHVRTAKAEARAEAALRAVLS
jgi:hypothetical protein